MLNDQIGRTYERFFELPLAVVVVVLWLVGALLTSTSVLVAYLGGLVLVRTLAGA